MTHSTLARLLAAAVLVAGAPTAAAAAAVTARGPVPADNPRAAWLDRFTESRQGPEQSDRLARTFKVGADATLDLENVSGDVRVTAGGNEIRIEAVKRVRDRDAGSAKTLLEQLHVEMNQVGNRVEVRTLSGRGGGRVGGSVDFTIVVPASTAVALKTVSGDIAVSGVGGELRAETISGDLELSGTPNVALAKTVSGTVTARDISSATAAVVMSSVSGNVVLGTLKARTLDVGTVSGDLRLQDVAVERLDAKSVSGNIECAAPLAKGGRYAFNSHSGDVRVAVLNGAGFELDATTFSGSVRSDFPITLRPDPGDRGGRGRPNRAIRGSFGDAGAVLSVRSFSGSVVISK